jgi:hypothetical protein
MHEKGTFDRRFKPRNGRDIPQDLVHRMLCIRQNFGDRLGAIPVGFQQRCLYVVESDLIAVPAIERCDHASHEARADNRYPI